VSEPSALTDHHLLVRLAGRLVKGIAFGPGLYQSPGCVPGSADVVSDTSPATSGVDPDSSAAGSAPRPDTARSAALMCWASPATRSSTALTYGTDFSADRSDTSRTAWSITTAASTSSVPKSSSQAPARRTARST